VLAPSAGASFDFPSVELVLPLSSVLASSWEAPESSVDAESEAPVPPDESSAAEESSLDAESADDAESLPDEESSVEAESLEEESSAELEDDALLEALLDDEPSSSVSIFIRSGNV
jgi:hypothetical protein